MTTAPRAAGDRRGAEGYPGHHVDLRQSSRGHKTVSEALPRCVHTSLTGRTLPRGAMPPAGDGPARPREEGSAFGPVTSEAQGFPATQRFCPSAAASSHAEAVRTFCREGADPRQICGMHSQGRTEGTL